MAENQQEEIRKKVEAWDAKFTPENVNSLCERLLARKIVKTMQEAHDQMDIIHTIIRQAILQGKDRFSIAEYADRMEKLQWFNESLEKHGKLDTVGFLFPHAYEATVMGKMGEMRIDGLVNLIRESIIYGAFDVKKIRKGTPK